MGKKVSKPSTLDIIKVIAQQHLEQYKVLTQQAIEPVKPKRERITVIPEDLKKCVNLGHYKYGGIDFSNFTYRDLQKACIIRGMPPEELVEGDIHSLHSWMEKNEHNKIDPNLLDDFDDWRDKLLREKYGEGQPFIRLGYVGKTDDEGNAVNVYKPEPKKPKKHVEKDTEMGGLWKGTKKHLTAQCKKDGLSFEKTVAKVKAAFPDAKESSIKIWYKRS